MFTWFHGGAASVSLAKLAVMSDEWQTHQDQDVSILSMAMPWLWDQGNIRKLQSFSPLHPTFSLAEPGSFNDG